MDTVKTEIKKIGASDLAQLIKSRNLNNIKMARILGVEGWTIGAWLSGKREISEKIENS